MYKSNKKKLTEEQYKELFIMLDNAAKNIDNANKICNEYFKKEDQMLYQFGKINSHYCTSHLKKVIDILTQRYDNASSFYFE